MEILMELTKIPENNREDHLLVLCDIRLADKSVLHVTGSGAAVSIDGIAVVARLFWNRDAVTAA